MLTAVRARFRAAGLISSPFAETLLFWGGVQHGFNPFEHDPEIYAQGVTCPVLLLHGTADNRVLVAEVESIHRRLAGEKELHLFEGLGHHSYVAHRPREWRDQVAAFLGRSLPQARSPE
jgi:pimeloyl-ACP methyl ester carboxylesterase